MSFPPLALAQRKNVPEIKWKLAAELPPSNEQSKSLGFAGAIHGVSNNALIVAGGANFPNGLPWEGGKKKYSKEIYVLEKNGSEFFWNKKVTDTLPEPIAYCGNTSTAKGIVYIGGENTNGISNKCFLLNWNSVKNCIDIRPLPNLPVALTNVAATNIGNVVYAAGGDETKNSSDSFFCLNLDDSNPEWKTLPSVPIALANATAIAQNGNAGKEIFIIGGRTKTPSGISELHHTIFAFDIQKDKWEQRADIVDGINKTNLSAACGVALGSNDILIAGFDNGKVFHKIEMYISQISLAKTDEEKEKLTKEKNELSIHHQGFDKSLLLYNTISNTWTKSGELPFAAHVTTTAVKWGNDIVISNGEIKPGIRTPNVMIGEIVGNNK
jgi:cyclically-permuted mutarotase family protein